MIITIRIEIFNKEDMDSMDEEQGRSVEGRSVQGRLVQGRLVQGRSVEGRRKADMFVVVDKWDVVNRREDMLVVMDN